LLHKGFRELTYLTRVESGCALFAKTALDFPEANGREDQTLCTQ